MLSMEVRDGVKMRTMGKRQRRQLYTIPVGAGIVIVITTAIYLLAVTSEYRNSHYNRGEPSSPSAKDLVLSRHIVDEQKSKLRGNQVILEYNDHVENHEYVTSNKGDHQEVAEVAAKEQILDSHYSPAEAYPVIPQSSRSGFFYPTRWLWRHFSSIDTTEASNTQRTDHDDPRDSRKSSNVRRSRSTDDEEKEKDEEEVLDKENLSVSLLPSIDIVKRKTNDANTLLETVDARDSLAANAA